MLSARDSKVGMLYDAVWDLSSGLDALDRLGIGVDFLDPDATEMQRLGRLYEIIRHFGQTE